MEHYVIAYDIKDEKRRGRIFKILKAYATHVQYSIFETYISPEDIIMLKYKIRKVINVNEDSVFIYRQCNFCSRGIERLGLPVVVYGDSDIII